MDELIQLGVRQEGEKIVVSSRMVAENFEKEHSHVMRDIRNIISQFNQSNLGVVEDYFIKSSYIDAKGEVRPEYLLTKNGFVLLTMGWTGEKAMKFKIAYINEFNRMEQELKNKLPADPRQLLAAAVLEAQKIIEEQDKQIQQLLPKAEFFDAVAGSKDAISMGEAAKIIYEETHLGRNKLFKVLRQKGILMRDNVPYQEYVDRGYFRTIEQKYTRPDGTTCINIKTLVYQKGLDYIRKVLKEDNVIALKRA